MKKYLFVFSLLALVASVACDTSSKASTTPTAAPPQTVAVAQPEAVAIPTLVPIDSTPNKASMKKQFSKKDMLMQRAEMAPANKEPASKNSDNAPIKN